MTTLVIVESPAKTKKIQEYLGKGYTVTSSMGHIRALKQDLDAVGIERGWTPAYEIMPAKAKTVKQLKDLASSAQEVVLATDDDREGEGIAFHICAVLKLNPLTTKRIVFHSITKQAIQEAIQNPKTIDMNKFQSQQTRAMLDMLIGYTISPVLWKQLNSNGLPLSAGRCQTPALKLVLDRDKEIESHNAKRFWQLAATFVLSGIPEIEASRSNLDEEQSVLNYLQPTTSQTKAKVKSLKESVRTSNAPKPLITSTLQQEASKQHNINPKAAMAAAQKLYEAGHITYMRTDNAFLSKEGAADCRKVIESICGPEYLGPEGQHQGTAASDKADEAKPKDGGKKKKVKKDDKPEAQAAHEAIRPTHPENEHVNELGPMEAKIYHLIWTRALQSQMAASTEDARAIAFTIDTDTTQEQWYGEQIKSKFLGYKMLTISEKVEESQKAQTLVWDAWSKVTVGMLANWAKITAEESFTKAHARYTEASLIHELETKGIGRPSTFAALVTTIVDRNYVEKSDSAGTQLDVRKWLISKAAMWPPKETTHKQTVGKESNKLQSTPLGRTVAEFIYKNYADIFDYTYTALMEQELDKIAQGTRSWTDLLQSNWDSYKERYVEHTTKAPANKEGQQKQANKRDLGEGIVVILSRKGPLLLKEETKEFASLPPRTSYETVTLAQAKAAYESKDGLNIGSYNDQDIMKKKGPYGFYVQYKDIKIPYKPEDTLESIIDKIKAKESPTESQEPLYCRKVGDFTIKQGPYGLYFFKHTLKKVAFVTFPSTADKDKVTAEDLVTLYKTGLEQAANKKKWVKKDSTK
jgi:DNA topoisomerase-1